MLILPFFAIACLEFGLSAFLTALLCLTLYEFIGFAAALWDVAILLFATVWVAIHQLITWPERKRARDLELAERRRVNERTRATIARFERVKAKELELKARYGDNWFLPFNEWLVQRDDVRK